MISFKLFLEQYILNENVINEVPRNILGMETSYKNFPIEQPYGFWVDRSGNWIMTNDHYGTAADILEKTNKYLKSKGKQPERFTSYYNNLFEAGFMRVVMAGGSIYNERESSLSPPSSSQLKFLNMCKDTYELEISNR